MVPERGATLRHVARRAGVGVGTTSRVFSGNGYVSERAREAVLEAARELNYSLHPAARALATGRSQVIALWARGVFSPWFSSIVGPVQRRTAQDHYRLLIDDIGLLNDAGEIHPGQWPVDGILAMSSVQLVGRYLESPPAAQRPIVSMGYYCHGKTDFVRLDLRAAADEAMRHLLESGRQRIVYIGSEGALETDARTRAYFEAMSEAGLPPATMIVPSVLVQNGRRRARAAIQSWLQENTLPQAFFCWNDDLAIAAYRALADIGARVPGDVALVGCDGIEDTEFLDVPISTSVTPFEEMCEAAWTLLRRRMNDPAAPIEHIVLPLRFEARASSGL